MSIIGEIVSKAVSNIVEDTAISTLAKTVDVVSAVAKKGKRITNGVSDGVGRVVESTIGDKETRHYRKEKRYLRKSANSTYLIIQKSNAPNDCFSIYDSDELIKYFAQEKKSSKFFRLSLLGPDMQLLGTVRKTALSIRTPVFHESSPADYLLEIMGEKVGALKTKLSASKENYVVEPFGWIIKGNILKWDFTVNNGDEIIAHISRRKGYKNPTFIIDYPKEENEIIGLLIILTLICREE